MEIVKRSIQTSKGGTREGWSTPSPRSGAARSRGLGYLGGRRLAKNDGAGSSSRFLVGSVRLKPRHLSLRPMESSFDDTVPTDFVVFVGKDRRIVPSHFRLVALLDE